MERGREMHEKKPTNLNSSAFTLRCLIFARFSLFVSIFALIFSSIFARVSRLHALILKRAFKYAPSIGKTLPWGGGFNYLISLIGLTRSPTLFFASPGRLR